MKKSIIALILGVCSYSAHAIDANARKATINPASAECYDSLLCQWRASNTFSVDRFFDQYIDLDSTIFDVSQTLPDSVYEARLKAMISPIHLPYNDIIKKYILMYTSKRGALMGRILGLSQYYFPLIEQELANNGLPLELRMLPVIESALTPSAVSRAGATGLWQFMYGTGKAFGLEITSFVDQRREPLAATRAACRYLAELHRMYNDWTLALAAYNCGPGNVNKALKRAGSGATTYWDIYPYLPTETRGYVPAFVAATYAYNYHKLHGISPIPAPLPVSTDTVMVSKLLHLEQVASTVDVPIDVLRALNPQYKLDIIPAVDRPYALTLPSTSAIKYIELLDSIHAKDSIYLAQYLKSASTGAAAAKSSFTAQGITHRVKNGEVLGSIARKYGVTVSQIMKWNNLKSANKLRVGQTLHIYK